MLEEFHKEMKEQISKRKQRFELAEFNEDTTRQDDLISASFEEAGIRYFKFTGRQAKKAIRRSRVTFQKGIKDIKETNVNDEELRRPYLKWSGVRSKQKFTPCWAIRCLRLLNG